MSQFLRATAVTQQGRQGFGSSRQQQAPAGKPSIRFKSCCQPYYNSPRSLPRISRTCNTSSVAASSSSRDSHSESDGHRTDNGGLKCNNIFDLLKVPFSTSAEDLRRSYRRRAKELHPDVNHASDAAESFHHLQKVYKEWRASQENFGPGGKSSQSREFMNMSRKAMEESFAEDYDSDFW